MTRTATLRRSFPTLWWLGTAPARWIAKSRRRIWGAAGVLLAIVAGPPLWWATQLIGLPDIGAPFDVAAFRAFTIPDDRNAMVLYRQAAARLKPLGPVRKTAGAQVNLLVPWSKVDPAVRRWMDENREALDVYRQGAGRPDALERVPEFGRGHSEPWGLGYPLNSLREMAMLEGSRLQEQGEMAGAWDWYRTVLRTIGHIGMRGTVLRRLVVQRWHDDLRKRLASWAADPRTSPALLRQAVDEVAACEALAPSESYTLRAEYLDIDRLLDDPKDVARLPNQSWYRSVGFLALSLTPEQMRDLYNAWQFWRREPERSRRVIRLAMANWLAYYDAPPGDRPRPDPDASWVYPFYPFGPGAPAQARVLSPQAIAGWLDSTSSASFLLGYWGWNSVRFRERSNHRALLILLGQQLYRRDRGTDPPTPEALVGPYLPHLPPDDPDEERDETIPRSGDTIE